MVLLLEFVRVRVSVSIHVGLHNPRFFTQKFVYSMLLVPHFYALIPNALFCHVSASVKSLTGGYPKSNPTSTHTFLMRVDLLWSKSFFSFPCLPDDTATRYYWYSLFVVGIVP